MLKRHEVEYIESKRTRMHNVRTGNYVLLNPVRVSMERFEKGRAAKGEFLCGYDKVDKKNTLPHHDLYDYIWNF